MNTTVISGRLVRNPGYNEVENEKGGVTFIIGGK